MWQGSAYDDEGLSAPRMEGGLADVLAASVLSALVAETTDGARVCWFFFALLTGFFGMGWSVGEGPGSLWVNDMNYCGQAYGKTAHSTSTFFGMRLPVATCKYSHSEATIMSEHDRVDSPFHAFHPTPRSVPSW